MRRLASTKMPNPWFRLYSEFADDPKVQMMSESDQRRLVMLFCERCKDETFRETERAFHWRVSPQELAETKMVFIENGFIDSGWNLINWNRRQFISDSSTERVRKHRQALKQDETLHETDVTVTVTAPDTDTEAEQKQKKPSRVKKLREGPTKTDLAKSRHAEFKAAVGDYWKGKNPDVQMPWGPAEGRNLEMWLRESPQTTLEQFKAFLRNRWKSEVNHAERPSRWIGNVTGYAAGPLDKFGRPINGGNNGQQNCTSPAEQRRVENLTNLATVAARRYGVGPLSTAGGCDGVQAEPGALRRDAGGVSERVGGDDAKARPGDVPGCVIEGVA